MIKLHELTPYKGSRKRRKVGRRGLVPDTALFRPCAKGQNARKSGGVRQDLKADVSPLIRQAPKLRGFKSHTRNQSQ